MLLVCGSAGQESVRDLESDMPYSPEAVVPAILHGQQNHLPRLNGVSQGALAMIAVVIWDMNVDLVPRVAIKTRHVSRRPDKVIRR